MSGNERTRPGTVPPAKIRKAACGIRFEPDELHEGIDFSKAVQLRPTDEDSPPDPVPAINLRKTPVR